MANIFKEAKKVQRLHPKLTWQQAIKQASKQHKKVGAYKVVEKGESKKTPVKSTYQAVRSKSGTFKGMKKIGAARNGKHTDTKSHNVNVSVVSGMKSFAKAQLAKALFDYEMAKTIKATKAARKRIVHYRKVLKTI